MGAIVSSHDNQVVYSMTTETESAPKRIRFHFGLMPEKLDVMVEDNMVIGRNDNEHDVEVDLGLYGAHECGMSRRHAQIRIIDDILHIVDLGSRNGTIVNGSRLTPFEAHPVCDGDTIYLGHLPVTVRFLHSRIILKPKKLRTLSRASQPAKRIQETIEMRSLLSYFENASV